MIFISTLRRLRDLREQNDFNLFLLLQQKQTENIIDNTSHRFLFIYVRQ